MALTQIVGSDSVKDALKTKANAGFTQTDTNQTEIVNARDGEANLLAKINALKTAIAALNAANVAWVTENHTANDTLVAADLIVTLHHNASATGSVELGLPAGVAGYVGWFYVAVAQTFKLTADGTEKIRYGATQSAAGGFVQSATVGTLWQVKWIGTEWVVSELTGVGILSFDGSTNVRVSPELLDEDDMASDSATAIATQQSIKKYIDDKAQYEFLPIAWSNGGVVAPDVIEAFTVNNQTCLVRKFSGSATQDVTFIWQVPQDVTTTGIKFRVIGFITEGTNPSTEGAAFLLSGQSMGNDDPLGAAFADGTGESLLANNSYATNDRWASAWSSAITITNLIAGETAVLKFERDHDHASDTYVQDIGVIGIEVRRNQ